MAQETLLSISLKEYKTELDDLRASLAKLEKGSKEYEKTAQEIEDRQDRLNEAMKVGRKSATALEGSYNAISQEMSRLKKEWKATNDEARRNELGKQIDSLNTQLKNFDKTIGVTNRNVGNYESGAVSLKAQLKQLQTEMANLLAQGVKPTDQAFLGLAKRAGDIKDAIKDAGDVVNQFSDDFQGMTTTIEVAKAGVSVFGLFTGTMSMLGIESERAQEAMQKLQGAMLVLQSLNEVQKALEKSGAVYRVLHKGLEAIGLARASNTATSVAEASAVATETTAEIAQTAALTKNTKETIENTLETNENTLATDANTNSVVGNTQSIASTRAVVQGAKLDFQKLTETQIAALPIWTQQTGVLDNTTRALLVQSKALGDDTARIIHNATVHSNRTRIQAFAAKTIQDDTAQIYLNTRAEYAATQAKTIGTTVTKEEAKAILAKASASAVGTTATEAETVAETTFMGVVSAKIALLKAWLVQKWLSIKAIGTWITTMNGAKVATLLFNGALKLMKLAIAATGIGFLVVAIGALMENWDKLTNSIKKAAGIQNNFNGVAEKTIDLIKKETQATDDEVRIMEAQGKSELEIIAYKQQKNQEQIQEIKNKIQDIKTTKEQIKATKEWYENIKNWSETALKGMSAVWQGLLWVVDKIFGTEYQDGLNKMLEGWAQSIADWVYSIDDADDEIEKLEEELKNLEATAHTLTIDKKVAEIKLQIDNAKAATDRLAAARQKSHDAYLKQIEEELRRLAELHSQYMAYNDLLMRLKDAKRQLTEEDKNKYAKDKLQAEMDYLQKLEKLYSKFSKDEKLTEDERHKYAVELQKTKALITNKSLEQQIESEKQHTEKLKKEFKDRIDASKQGLSETLKNMDFKKQQLTLQISPEIDMKSLSKSNFMDNFKGLDGLNGELERVRENISETIASFATMSEEDKNYADSKYQIDLFYASLVNEQTNKTYEYQKELIKKQMQEFAEGTTEYISLQQQLYNTEQEQAKANADYIIEQTDRIQKKKKQDTKDNKEYVKNISKGYQEMGKSVANIMGSVADIMKDNLDQKVKNGEISEEQAEEEFERIKKVQIGQAVINTLAGAIGSFEQAMATYAPPYGAIIGGLASAAAIAAGVAQINQISKQEYGNSSTSSTGGSSGGGATMAAVQPLLNEDMDSQQLTALNTEQMAGNQQTETKVYVVESDISNAQNNQKTRVSQTTF